MFGILHQMRDFANHHLLIGRLRQFPWVSPLAREVEKCVAKTAVFAIQSAAEAPKRRVSRPVPAASRNQPANWGMV